MKRFFLALAGLALCSPALAHGGEPARIGDEASVLIPLAIAAMIYMAGAARLWSRAGAGRGVRMWQAACFATGLGLLSGLVLSPLHALSARLFTAHMIEHEALMVIAAPLIVVARPLGAMLWGLPQSWRRGLGALGRARWFARSWGFISAPLPATVLHGAALWAWHAPALYEAALEGAAAHWLQHACFLLTGMLFWHALIHRRAERGAAVFYLFATALHSGFLGILLAVARAPLFPTQSSGAAAFGLTPLEDQQLAGVIMWVPAGCVYAGAALVFAGLWIAGSSVGLTLEPARPSNP